MDTVSLSFSQTHTHTYTQLPFLNVPFRPQTGAPHVPSGSVMRRFMGRKCHQAVNKAKNQHASKTLRLSNRKVHSQLLSRITADL